MTDIVDTSKLQAFIPVIDDRSEEAIASQGRDLISFLSNGQLNDFTDGDPLGVLLRAQAFASGELTWRVNKLPLALIVSFLVSAGVERKLASKSRVNITFTLSAPRNTPYQIPAGFEVVATTGSLRFFTTAILTIPAGLITGSVIAEAEKAGASYNLPAFSISRVTQPLAFLSAAINTTAASGGAKAEAVEDTINRGFQQIRIRNLVSELDFQQAAVRSMGVGSAAKCVGLLGGNKITLTPGAIHIFCLTPDGQPAGIGAINKVQTDLQPNILLGTTLFVSPMDVSPVDIFITARISTNFVASAIADKLETAIREYLSPQTFLPGSTLQIEEMRHQLRFVEGVEFIDFILQNGQPLNIEPSSTYSILQYRSLSAKLTDGAGNVFELGRGELDAL